MTKNRMTKSKTDFQHCYSYKLHTMQVLRVFSGGMPPLWFLRYGCQTSASPYVIW